jgi:hypothetical protein
MELLECCSMPPYISSLKARSFTAACCNKNPDIRQWLTTKPRFPHQVVALIVQLFGERAEMNDLWCGFDIMSLDHNHTPLYIGLVLHSCKYFGKSENYFLTGFGRFP